MITKTKGLVLSYIKYGDTSIICKIFTDSFGLQSYIINGIRNSKTKNIALYQPLNILDMVVYYKKNSRIQRIKEAKLDVIYVSIHNDMKKVSVCFFLSEFLSKILNNESDQEDKFDFIQSSLIEFDRLNSRFSNFHIQFLIKLSKYYGIDIISSDQLIVLNNKDQLLVDFIQNCIDESYQGNINSNNILRNKVINLIIEYFSIHLEINIKLKSTDVLKEIFN
ncbi:MAG: DNA repair protein RecO [Euryarchaeota archaeon]|nr:DNA repair protein RecO [Euryarchaeota archaeon]MEC7858167.1 DNA repair protein RecO [Bacteroidota bacterium]|tara:strand:- start:608 stop:1273 length:666 start_codon:yes stop_codon:yes gene_type:complete